MTAVRQGMNRQPQAARLPQTWQAGYIPDSVRNDMEDVYVERALAQAAMLTGIVVSIHPMLSPHWLRDGILSSTGLVW